MTVEVLSHSILTEATLSASSTEAGYSIKAILKGREYLWWKAGSAPSTILVTCAQPEEADYLFISNHNLSGATIEIRGSTDNFSASNVLVATDTVTSNNPLLLRFTAATYQYWRVVITGSSPAALSLVLLGKSIEIPGRIGGTFDPLGRKFSGMKNINENGQPLGTSYLHETWEEKITINEIPQDWLRDTWLPAWRATIRDNPIAVAWNPELYPDEVQVVVVKGGFESKHQYGLTTDLSFSVIGRYQ